MEQKSAMIQTPNHLLHLQVLFDKTSIKQSNIFFVEIFRNYKFYADISTKTLLVFSQVSHPKHIVFQEKNLKISLERVSKFHTCIKTS